MQLEKQLEQLVKAKAKEIRKRTSIEDLYD